MPRPTKYTKEILKAAREYADGGWKEAGDAVPTIVGLAMELKVTTETLYDWEKQEDKAEFSDILTRVRNGQHRNLVNNGLLGEFNPAITKMMLTKHGYSDRVGVDMDAKVQADVNATISPSDALRDYVSTIAKRRGDAGDSDA